jgi:hypothetical protein
MEGCVCMMTEKSYFHAFGIGGEMGEVGVASSIRCELVVTQGGLF